MSVRLSLLACLALAATLSIDKVSAADPAAAFDKAAAVQALTSVDLGSCKAKQGGDGHVFITFGPSGSASEVVVDKGEFGSPKVGKCIVGKFKKVTVPRFDGGPVRVGKSFHLDS
jgi:hypothetical protein